MRAAFLLLEAAPMPAPAPAMARGERPLGVTILAVLMLVVGGLMALGGLAAVGFGGAFASLGMFSAVPGLALLGGLGIAFVGVMILLLGAVVAVVGYGFWEGQPWAWTVALVLTLVGIVTALFSLPGGIVSILIDLFLLWYYTREGVQRWFGKVGAWPAAQVNQLLDRAGVAK